MSACGTYDPGSGILHIPSLELGTAAAATTSAVSRFWLDLEFVDGIFSLKDFGRTGGTKDIPATLDVSTLELHIPYVYLWTTIPYWIDMKFVKDSFRIVDFGENREMLEMWD